MVLADALACETSVLAIASIVHVVVEEGSIDDHHYNCSDPATEENPEELQ